MTSHVARLYVAAASLLVLFLVWAAIAAHPWPRTTTASASDPRLVALRAREQALRAETIAVNRILAQRRAAAQVRAQTISAPVQQAPVRVVTLPPLTITRTS